MTPTPAMGPAVDATGVAGPGAARPWGLWGRQVRGIMRLELRKVLFSPWALIGWGLALLPVGLLTLRVIVVMVLARAEDISDVAAEMVVTDTVYAVLFETLILRLCVFFGCLAIFINLFRGESSDRTLHYYLLAPVRREVLVAGKFLGGLLGAALLFGSSTLVTRLLLLVPAGASEALRLATGGAWLSHTLAYVAVALLACLGYGALFLFIGLLPVNPIIPAVPILGWESANTFLPVALKPISLIFHLISLCPVPFKLGPIAIVAQPASPPVALAGLLGLSGILVAAAMRRARGMEVDYGED